MGFHGDTHHDLIWFQIFLNSSFSEQTKCTQQIGIKMLEDMSDDASYVMQNLRSFIYSINPTNKFSLICYIEKYNFLGI